MDQHPTTLVVLAAGVGSRYGGLKQLDGVGPGGATLMDYAVFDAARAGLRQVVFVLRRELERDFHTHCGQRYAQLVDVGYVFQELDALPGGRRVPDGRRKPWGTGQATLCAAERVRGPFVVCNADDFYGAEGLRLLADFLARPDEGPRESYALVGYELRRTLSAHGSVSRGVCQAEADGRLRSVREYTGLEPRGRGAVQRDADGRETLFVGDEPVSLNLWGFRPGFFHHLREHFARFLDAEGASLQAEFYLPFVVDELIRAARVDVRLLRTSSPWFGMTHQGDRALVAERLRELHARGDYPERLFA